MRLNLIRFYFVFITFTIKNIRSEINTGEIDLSKFHIINYIKNPGEFIDLAFKIVQDISAEKSQIDASTLNETFTRTNHYLNEIYRNLKLVNITINEIDDQSLKEEKEILQKDILESIHLIDHYYNYFQEAMNEKNEDELEYYNNSINYNMASIKDSLKKIHDTITKKKDRLKSTLFNDLECSEKQPINVFVHNFYILLSAVDLKGIMLELYNIPERVEVEKINTYEVIEEIIKTYTKRLEERKETMKTLNLPSRINSSRQYWNCSSEREPHEGTFANFSSIFQKTMVMEEHLRKIRAPTQWYWWCYQLCKDYDNSISLHADTSILRNCTEVLPRGNDIELCYSKAPKRKYEYIESLTWIYGERNKDNECDKNDTIMSYGELLYNCDVCECINEDVINRKYVSLVETTSNVQENKVVVGLRLKIDHDTTLKIDIEEAEIMPAGVIDESTKSRRTQTLNIDWNFPQKHYKRSYRVISWNSRTFSLDDVQLDEGYVLTGAKFIYDSGVFRIAARGHKYDYEKGKLIESEHIWRKSESKLLSEEIVENLDVPIYYPDNKIYSRRGEYVKLSTSNMTKDAGQTTVPFVDTVPVEPIKRSPLSGFGLFLKRDEDSAGYLTLKLFGYDFERPVY